MAPEYGLGRRPQPDVRNAEYPMRTLLQPFMDQFFPRGIPDGTRHYFAGPMLDQHKTGTCTAFSVTSKLNAAPIMQRLHISPFDLYRIIVGLDQFDDNDHEAHAPDDALQLGSSVLASVKAVRDLGFVKSFLWAQLAEDVRSWILSGFGGVLMGTLWKSEMFKPDADGFISYRGQEEGGHAYYLNGWNDSVRRNGRRVRAARIKNSWGEAWGDGGYAWIEMDDLQKAIADDGEAVALTEVKVNPR